MKNKKYFSLHLYLEGLKQIKKTGICLLIVLAIMSIFTFYDSRTIVYSYFDINPMLTLMFMFIAPVLTINLFRIFNKRNSSDFYYSMPYSRICIYISYVLSVITWIIGIFIIILIPSLLSAIYYRNVIIIYPVMIKDFVGLIAASMLVVSAITLAMSLTGKLYANILLSGIIIFMPRTIMYFLIIFTTHKYPHLEVENFWGILNSRYNIVTHSLNAIFYDNPNYIHTEGVIYTSIVAIIYFILAAICYNKRKSDIAQTVGSKFVHSVITGALPTFICIATCLLEGFIFYYLVGILIFFIFEFTISKDIIKALKRIPLFLIAILIGHIFDVSIDIIGNTTRTTKLEADEIDYITLTPAIDLYRYNENNNYYELLSYEVKVDDEKILEMVAKSLKESDAKNYKNKSESYIVPVAIHSGNKVYYRNLFFSSYANEINQALEKNAELLIRSTTLPDYSDVYIESFAERNDAVCSENDIKNIYNTYIQELQQYDAKLQYEILYDSISTSSTYEFGIYFMHKGQLAKIPYAEISREYTPESYEAYDKLTK